MGLMERWYERPAAVSIFTTFLGDLPLNRRRRVFVVVVDVVPRVRVR